MILAYLDPGAGSLVLQAILAVLLTVPFFLRTKLASFVAHIRRRETDSSDSPSH